METCLPLMVSLLAARPWCLVYMLILVLLGDKKYFKLDGLIIGTWGNEYFFKKPPQVSGRTCLGFDYRG